MRRLAATTGELQFIFDLTPESEKSSTGVAGRVLEALLKRSTGGRSFERDARTRGDIVLSLRDAGLDDIQVVTSSEAAHAWSLPEPDRRTQVVLFVSQTSDLSTAHEN